MTKAEPIGHRGARTHGYRAVWRWHFLAALWVAPVLMVMAATGALYLFDREIEGWWNRDVQTVTASGEPLSLAQQEAAVTAGFPTARLKRLTLPRTAGEATIWTVDIDGSSRDIYLNPYSGEIEGTTNPDMQPMTIVRKIHGTLFAGEIGSYIIELVACWALVMMVTGIWMWWPRHWKLRGVLAPRLSANGRRYWRDLHSIPAMFNAAFAILLVLTGLPWSVFWGPQFARIGEVVPFVAASPNFKAPPKVSGNGPADAHAMHKAQASDHKLPWTIRQIATPTGTGLGHARIADIEKLLPLLDRERWGGGIRIIYPAEPGQVFTLSYVPDKAQGQRTLYVDPGSGRLVGNIGWSDYSPVAKVVEWGVATHMGRQYGLVNQIANLVVCLVLIASIIAGITLWWKRRPAGTVGAPALGPADKLPTDMAVTFVLLGIVFPLMGLSMVLVLLVGRIRQFSRHFISAAVAQQGIRLTKYPTVDAIRPVRDRGQLID